MPTEKDVPTIKVEVKIPAEVTISRFEPKSGWKTYKDGSIVEWTGAPDAKTPASVTMVNPKVADAIKDSHGATIQQPEVAKNNPSSSTSFYLSIAALVLGLLSLVFSLRKKTK